MAPRRINLSYDDEKHALVHLALTNHNEPSDSAYMRLCIEFYELNKTGVLSQEIILERLNRIEAMLKNGIVTGPSPTITTEPDDTDDIFDDALAQLD